MGLKNFGFIANEFVESVRKKFMDGHYQLTPDLYSQEDIDQVIEGDWTIKRFLILAYKNEEEAARLMAEALRWRKECNLRHLKDNYFPAEFYRSGAIFIAGPDRGGIPSLVMRLKYVKRIPELLDDIKRFLVHWTFKIDESRQGAGWMLVMDFTDCGYGHYENIDLLHYFVSTMHYQFPAGMDYVLAVDLPWALKTFWSMVKYWIPEKRRDMVKFASRSCLGEYFEDSCLPLALGGTSDKVYNAVPANCPSALEFGMHTVGVDKERCLQILDLYKPLLELSDQNKC